MAVGGGCARKLYLGVLVLVCPLGCIVPGRGHDRGYYNFGMGLGVGNVQRHDGALLSGEEGSVRGLAAALSCSAGGAGCCRACQYAACCA